MKSLVIYAYVNKDNKQYLQDIAKKYHTSLSKVINSLISENKKAKRVLPLKDETPKYVKRAEKWKEKNTLNV